jgi:hypothetical protein
VSAASTGNRTAAAWGALFVVVVVALTLLSDPAHRTSGPWHSDSDTVTVARTYEF